MRSLFILLGLLAATTGLADTMGDAFRWGHFPVPIYVSPEINASPEKMADFEAAIHFWEERARKPLFDFKGPWAGPQTPYDGSLQDRPLKLNGNIVMLADDFEPNTKAAGLTTSSSINKRMSHALVRLNAHLDFCNGLCEGNRGEQVSFRRVLAHELGHFLGLDHTQDQNDIMYYMAAPDGDLDHTRYDADDLAKVLAEF